MLPATCNRKTRHLCAIFLSCILGFAIGFSHADPAWDDISVNTQFPDDFFKASPVKFTIIVFCWKRAESLNRLLDSLIRSDYAGKKVDLQLRIDGNSSIEVVDIVSQFKWPHGSKKVALKKRNAGLAKSILNGWNPKSASSFAIMLEDDCEVSRFFFRYLLLVLEKFDIPNKLTANPADFFTSDLENLVGISLYAPILNELVSPTRNWSSASIFNSSYGSPSSSAEFSSTFGLRVRSASSCLNTLLPCPALYRFQLPCSWGALYFPWWWIRLQRYYRYRTSKANMHLDVSYLVPNSYSNFWSKSWKKWA